MRSDTAARAAHVAELERQYQIVRLPWTGDYAYSIASLRQICGPPVEDDKTYATNVHEICHCIEGECQGTWPHERGESGCLECEKNVWQRSWSIITARGLGSVAVFDRLQYALGTYRRSPIVPQPRPAAQAADRLMNFVHTYAQPLQTRVEIEWRRDLVRAWQQEVNDQPNSLATCRERLARAMK